MLSFAGSSFNKFAVEKWASFSDLLGIFKKNPFFLIFFVAVTFALSNLISISLGKVYEYIFPALDDTAQIMKNQNDRFDHVNKLIASLSRNLSESDLKKIGELKSEISMAVVGSRNVAARLSQLTEDNERFRSVLKKDKGLDGGVDMILPIGGAYKIDGDVTLGLMGSSGRSFAEISLTSLRPGESVSRKSVGAGQGVNFSNQMGAQCQSTFLGFSLDERGNVYAGKFAYQCKNSKTT